MTLEQVRKDVQYLRKKFGHVLDFCGAWCNKDVMDSILFKDHSAKAIKEHLNSLIVAYFDVGYGDGSNFGVKITKHDLDDDEILSDIAERYLLDVDY